MASRDFPNNRMSNRKFSIFQKKQTVFDKKQQKDVDLLDIIKISLETYHLTTSSKVKSPPSLSQTAGILLLPTAPAGPEVKGRHADDTNGCNLRRDAEGHCAAKPDPHQFAPAEAMRMRRMDAHALPGCLVPNQQRIGLHRKHGCQHGHFCHPLFLDLVQTMPRSMRQRKKNRPWMGGRTHTSLFGMECFLALRLWF